MAEVVDRASTSQRTFYEHFANKEEALLAALDSGSAQMLATALPAFRRAPDWQHAVQRRLRGDVRLRRRRARVHAGSARSRCTRRANGRCRPATRSWKGSRRCSRPATSSRPDTPPIAAEAIGGAIYALVYDQVKAKGPESLPELVPMATYMTLAPFLGAEDAFALANGDS